MTIIAGFAKMSVENVRQTHAETTCDTVHVEAKVCHSTLLWF